MTVVTVILIMQGQQHGSTTTHNNNRGISFSYARQQHSQTNHKFNGYLMRRHQPSPQEAHWIKSMATAKLLALRSLQPVAPEGHEIPGPHGDSGCNMERQMVHLAHLTLDHFQPVSRILQAGATAHISVS